MVSESGGRICLSMVAVRAMSSVVRKDLPPGYTVEIHRHGEGNWTGPPMT